MEVTTRAHTIDRARFVRLLRLSYARRFKWMYVGILCALGLGLVLRDSFLVSASVFAGIGLALYRTYSFRRYANDPDDEAFSRPRTFRLTPEALFYRMSDGTEGKTVLSSIRRVDEIAGFYRLDVTKQQPHYIPCDAFETEEDRRTFELILAGQGLMKQQGPS